MDFPTVQAWATHHMGPSPTSRIKRINRSVWFVVQCGMAWPSHMTGQLHITTTPREGDVEVRRQDCIEMLFELEPEFRLPNGFNSWIYYAPVDGDNLVDWPLCGRCSWRSWLFDLAG